MPVLTDADADAHAHALARSAENPIANMISLPMQNNTNFNCGPLHHTRNILNIQPVIPIELTSEWNLTTRTVIPLDSRPGLAPGEGTTFGLGATQFSAFLSPSRVGRITWGVGPVVQTPTTTDRAGKPCLGRWRDRRGADHAGPLGGGGAREQHLVLRGLGCERLQRLHAPALHQLQLPAITRHLPLVLATCHGELGGERRAAMDGTVGSEHRTDLPRGEPASQRAAWRLLQRGAPRHRSRVAVARPGVPPVPEVMSSGA